MNAALTVVLLASAVLVLGCQAAGPAGGGDRAPARWAIVLHGGAGTIERADPEGLAGAYRAGLSEALREGQRLLAGGASALDAAEAVVRILEDNELFNAGRGAALTERGEAELDAAIMDGPTRRAGAVAGVTTVKNPISLARRVMERTRYILLAGPGAERFADTAGVERVPNSYFITPRRRKMLDDELRTRAAPAPARMGTVGVVALDQMGRLAAATSTGGLTGKMPGRIGDSPQIGAGTYADARVAVSGTGTGEQFIRHGVARALASRMELAGESVQQAADHLIFKVLDPDDGGLIALDARGNMAMPYSSLGMYRGAADSTGLWLVRIWEE